MCWLDSADYSLNASMNPELRQVRPSFWRFMKTLILRSRNSIIRNQGPQCMDLRMCTAATVLHLLPPTSPNRSLCNIMELSRLPLLMELAGIFSSICGVILPHWIQHCSSSFAGDTLSIQVIDPALQESKLIFRGLAQELTFPFDAQCLAKCLLASELTLKRGDAYVFSSLCFCRQPFLLAPPFTLLFTLQNTGSCCSTERTRFRCLVARIGRTETPEGHIFVSNILCCFHSRRVSQHRVMVELGFFGNVPDQRFYW